MASELVNKTKPSSYCMCLHYTKDLMILLHTSNDSNMLCP